MIISYKWLSSILGLLIAGGILTLVRRDYLHTRYAIWWLCIAVGVLVLGFFPGLVDMVGSPFGVHYPPILLVILCLGLVLIKMLTMDLERSRHERELRRLAQRLALLESLKSIESDESRKNAYQ
ncbi:MAG: DUF2304 domain-containing protein [Desulforhabdus sp.]|nr:DUF2304 domain-containing protein [Desulforhabdus sp.]